MGQKIFWLIVTLSACCLGVTRYGSVQDLSGIVLVSRNELVAPVRASFIYDGDIVRTGPDSRLVIVGSQQRLTITSNQEVVITVPMQPGPGYLLEKYEVQSPTKSTTTALGLSLLFPGFGHWYIEDTIKAIPLIIGGAYLASNAIAINPGSSYTYGDNLYNQKTQYSQMYLVLWLWSLLDVYAETTNYNKKTLENLAE